MDKMREEFEAWFHDEYCHGCGKANYGSVVTVAAWKAWQASRAAQCVELPDSERSVDCGNVLYRSDVEEALDAAGIRYV